MKIKSFELIVFSFILVPMYVHAEKSHCTKNVTTSSTFAGTTSFKTSRNNRNKNQHLPSFKAFPYVCSCFLGLKKFVGFLLNALFFKSMITFCTPIFRLSVQWSNQNLFSGRGRSCTYYKAAFPNSSRTLPSTFDLRDNDRRRVF